MRTLYLVKRSERPKHHIAPYHPVILCDRKRVAEWEAGGTDPALRGGAWVWEREGWDDNPYGWILAKWNGLNIDYVGLVTAFDLPDGSHSAFWRDYEDWPQGVRDLFSGAVWWSDKQMPEWLEQRDVLYPLDDFTQQRILDSIANDGCSGMGRKIPVWWTQDSQAPVRDGRQSEIMSAFVGSVEDTMRRIDDNLVITLRQGRGRGNDRG